jgi:UDP-N-acetylmuramoyl-tripeptide--D-alanyl-D-alanine ligase
LRKITTSDLLKALGPKSFGLTVNEFESVNTDSRKSAPGSLFIALKGDNFDAHDFVEQACINGAKGVLVSEWRPQWEPLKEKLSFFQVSDCLAALQKLSNFYRKKSKAKIIGITGSNGKTTSKEFSAAVLSELYKTHYSKGSFNNHWGVPFSLLSEPAGTEISVIEMGMNHAGEIKRLCEIAEPDVVVCSMVGQAHIENFGSIDKIADAKQEIYLHAPDSAIRIFNLDNFYTNMMFQKAQSQAQWRRPFITFSTKDSSADVYLKINQLTASHIQITGKIAKEHSEQKIPIFGQHNLTNLMVAASVGLATEMPAAQIWKGLGNCRSTWGRNQIIKTKIGADILFDGYNANPDSMKALLENVSLIKNPGKKWAVFAEMLELGELSSALHFELGKLVGQNQFDGIWFYGPHAPDFESGLKKSGYTKNAVITKSYEDSLASDVASMLHPQDILFVKGSRGMKLERIVQACQPIGFSITKE